MFRKQLEENYNKYKLVFKKFSNKRLYIEKESFEYDGIALTFLIFLH